MSPKPYGAILNATKQFSLSGLFTKKLLSEGEKLNLIQYKYIVEALNFNPFY